MDFAVPVPRSSRLICWDAAREPERRRVLEVAGLCVDSAVVESGKLVTHIRLTQPDVMVIDLDRLPSHGRAVGVVLRSTKSTREIPIVFLGGEPEKVARIKADLPDAVFGAWSEAASVVLSAKAGTAPVLGHMQQWTGSPLEKKLGLSAGPVAVVGAPESFELSVPIETRITARTKLAIWFIRSREELGREMGFMALHPPLWIAFPKQTGRFKADFTQHDVRGLATEAEIGRAHV